MTNSSSLFESLIANLASAGAHNPQVEVPPVAILWPDKERQWQSLLPTLRENLPWLLTLGEYDPATRTGPSIWLRCMIARTLPEANWAEKEIPIIYLPGISKQELRAVEDCPREVAALAELQYRGKLWTHENGRDWSVVAFLKQLGITVKTDEASKEALIGALPKLAETSIEALRAEMPLSAAKVHSIVHPEPIEKLLAWIDDPTKERASYDANNWIAFCDICRKRWEFDPEKDGEFAAAQHLGKRDNTWAIVWNRFAKSPQHYRNLPALLERAKPTESSPLFDERSSWPQNNAEAETELREQLTAMHGLTYSEACKRVGELKQKHGERCNWVWAELGQAPLAKVLSPLAELAMATSTPCAGSNPTEIAESYAAEGWMADAAALKALAGTSSGEDAAAVKLAVESLYREWLRRTAETFQEAARNAPLAGPSKIAKPEDSAAGKCFLFSDGLRFDVANLLATALQERNFVTHLKWQFSALPGVTPTAKPAVSPIASLLEAGTDFDTVVRGGSKVTIDVLRKELNAHGFPVLLGQDLGTDAQRQRGAAWTESGNFDSYGHAQGWKLASRIDEEIRSLCERVEELLKAGWREVQIITDHGWLLMPGGLPKVTLEEHLTEKRKGRCARLKASADTDVQTVPWYWDDTVRMAMAPGICCFEEGKEYEHGGLSPQECVIPVLTVSTGEPKDSLVTIENVTWSGLRCRVTLNGAVDGSSVDIRTKAADAGSSVSGGGKVVSDQQASPIVEDEDKSGEAVLVVVLDANGRVIATQATEIGK